MRWLISLSCVNGVWLSSPPNVSALLINIPQPEVSQLQSLKFFCLALASVAFVYNSAWLARLTLVAPVMLILWQALRVGL